VHTDREDQIVTDHTALPTPDEARRLLHDADTTGRNATAAASWPGIAVLLALGATLSLGTLGMGLTAGTNYLVAMIGLLVWIAVVIGFQLVFLRSHKIGFGRRWLVYTIALFAVYLAAMVVVAGSQGEDVLVTCLFSAALAVVAVGAATYEARQAQR
jgi:hypothetical protein